MIKPWDEITFRKEFDKINARTLVDHHRCYTLIQFMNQALHFPGDIAEVGVYKGGTAKLIRNQLDLHRINWKTLHLFDTFEGMPKVDPTKDLHKEGDFKDTSLESVSDFVGSENTLYYAGVFPETAWTLNNKEFCFVHIDCDIYSSVKACCEFFYERMPKGGIMVFDDYGAEGCPGAKRAVDEFFDHPARIEEPIYLTTGQAVVFINKS